MLTLLLSSQIFINTYFSHSEIDKVPSVIPPHIVVLYNNDLCRKDSPPCW